MISGDKGMLCWIGNVTQVADSYPTTLSKDSLSRICPRNNRAGCSIVQVDVARIGGITPWLKTAHLVETFNMQVCPHYLMEIHVALCAAVPNAAWVEFIPQLDVVTKTRLAIVDGYAVPSSDIGVGISWDWKAIERMRIGHAVISQGK
jgi:L-alanine-DL-glutamate epimerase-like enolase superfamily enzyme